MEFLISAVYNINVWAPLWLKIYILLENIKYLLKHQDEQKLSVIAKGLAHTIFNFKNKQ